MSRAIRRCGTALALAVTASGFAVAPAGAAPDQRSILQDDARLVYASAEVREATLDELRALGVDTVKAIVPWRRLAPEGDSKPEGFDGANPGSYPDASWQPYDALVRGAQARGLEVFLMLAGPAPDWATAGSSSPAGVNRPDPAEFGAFVRAVATRYSGAFGGMSGNGNGGGGGAPLPIPPGASAAAAQPLAPASGGNAQPAATAAQAGVALPRVALWSVWNEPNLPRFLLPQRASNRAATPLSPAHYRLLLYAAHEALVATGHGDDTILIGELLPVGRSRKGARSSIRPLEFLRELACVDRRYRAFRGRAARQRGCEDFRALPGTGLAYHPYAPAGGPRARPPHADDATIGSLPRISAVLDRLYKRERLVTRRTPLFLTEFGFQTDPPDPFQTPIRRVPGFLGLSEWLAYRNARVASYAQYPLVDDAARGSGFARYSGFQSGLRFENGRTKPGVYDAYRFPLHVRRLGRSKAEVFGGVRAGSEDERVMVQTRPARGGKWRNLGRARLRARGYFRRTFRISIPHRRHFRFRYGTGSASRAAAAVR